jgi:hypothetical protein
MKADAAARLDPADHAILAMRVAGTSPGGDRRHARYPRHSDLAPHRRDRRPARTTPKRGLTSALPSSPPRIARDRRDSETTRRRRAGQSRPRPRIGTRLATAGLLGVLGLSLLLSVPALRPCCAQSARSTHGGSWSWSRSRSS